jgi:DNA modification methylase
MQCFLNVIYNQDCLEYLKSLPSESVNCCIIDEPYGILTGHKIEDGYNYKIGFLIRQEIYRILTKNSWFLFFGIFPNAYEFYKVTLEAGFKPWQTCNEIVWCKRSSSSPFIKINRIHENIFVFQKGNPDVYDIKAPIEDILVDNAFHGLANFASLKRMLSFYQSPNYLALRERALHVKKVFNNKTNDSYYNMFNSENVEYKANDKNIKYVSSVRFPSIFSFCTENKKHFGSHNASHPTVKPILLLRRLVKLFTQKGDVVLDCFMGSGTTAVACKQEGRHFVGCERDISYLNIANARLENYLEELENDNKWLTDRGVTDFESDIKEGVVRQGSLF